MAKWEGGTPSKSSLCIRDSVGLKPSQVSFRSWQSYSLPEPSRASLDQYAYEVWDSMGFPTINQSFACYLTDPQQSQVCAWALAEHLDTLCGACQGFGEGGSARSLFTGGVAFEWSGRWFMLMWLKCLKLISKNVKRLNLTFGDGVSTYPNTNHPVTGTIFPQRLSWAQCLGFQQIFEALIGFKWFGSPLGVWWCRMVMMNNNDIMTWWLLLLRLTPPCPVQLRVPDDPSWEAGISF